MHSQKTIPKKNKNRDYVAQIAAEFPPQLRRGNEWRGSRSHQCRRRKEEKKVAVVERRWRWKRKYLAVVAVAGAQSSPSAAGVQTPDREVAEHEQNFILQLFIYPFFNSLFNIDYKKYLF